MTPTPGFSESSPILDDISLAAARRFAQGRDCLPGRDMIAMDHADAGGEENGQKRKRRPKSYQGCTQCRLARRKCGEGTAFPFLCVSWRLEPLSGGSEILSDLSEPFADNFL